MIQFGNPHTAHNWAAMLFVLDNMPECDSDIKIYIGEFGIIHSQKYQVEIWYTQMAIAKNVALQ